MDSSILYLHKNIMLCDKKDTFKYIIIYLKYIFIISIECYTGLGESTFGM
jgi:hypothetical protein